MSVFITHVAAEQIHMYIPWIRIPIQAKVCFLVNLLALLPSLLLASRAAEIFNDNVDTGERSGRLNRLSIWASCAGNRSCAHHERLAGIGCGLIRVRGDSRVFVSSGAWAPLETYKSDAHANHAYINWARTKHFHSFSCESSIRTGADLSQLPTPLDELAVF